MDTKERLLQSAAKLFAERGFAGVGAREIAEQAGANLSAIPYHFKTKEALYLAVMTRLTKQIRGKLEPILTEAQMAARDADAKHAARVLDTLAHDLRREIATAPDSAHWSKPWCGNTWTQAPPSRL